jgi:hypothetical protein
MPKLGLRRILFFNKFLFLRKMWMSWQESTPLVWPVSAHSLCLSGWPLHKSNLVSDYSIKINESLKYRILYLYVSLSNFYYSGTISRWLIIVLKIKYILCQWPKYLERWFINNGKHNFILKCAWKRKYFKLCYFRDIISM